MDNSLEMPIERILEENPLLKNFCVLAVVINIIDNYKLLSPWSKIVTSFVS